MWNSTECPFLKCPFFKPHFSEHGALLQSSLNFTLFQTLLTLDFYHKK